ncbi:hypothetical protein D3C87_1861840 [compost metagenome]
MFDAFMANPVQLPGPPVNHTDIGTWITPASGRINTSGGSWLVIARANVPDALVVPAYDPLVSRHSRGASESIWTKELSLMLWNP